MSGSSDDKPCGCCSKIYKNFDDFVNHNPFCNSAGFTRHRDEDGVEKIVFYVPCKDDDYDSWFEFEYCPRCGRPMKYREVYR